jgi:hypothetical protein
MGTGVSLSPRPPENFLKRKFWLMVRGGWFIDHPTETTVEVTMNYKP